MNLFEIRPDLLDLTLDVPVTEFTVDAGDLGSFVFGGGGTVTLREDARGKYYLEVSGVMESDRPLGLKAAPSLLSVVHRVPVGFAMSGSWYEQVGGIADGSWVYVGRYLVPDDPTPYWSTSGGPPLAIGSSTVAQVLVTEAGTEFVYADGFLVYSSSIEEWAPWDHETGGPRFPLEPSEDLICLPEGHLYLLVATDDPSYAHEEQAVSDAEYWSSDLLGRRGVEWDALDFEDEPPGFAGWAVVAVDSRGRRVGRIGGGSSQFHYTRVPVFGDTGAMHVMVATKVGASAPVEVAY